jgi:hypothetical protein
MKNFRIQIYAYGYRADFVITAKGDPKNIDEASIGEMSDPNIKRITYEEVVNDPQSHPRPLQEKKVVGA